MRIPCAQRWTDARSRALLAGVLLLSASALAAPPSIERTMPYAVAPGQSVDVTLFGKNLQGAKTLWTSFDASAELTPGIEKNGTESGKVTFRISVPKDTPMGVGGIRVASPEGVSSLALLMIDELPTVSQDPRNRDTDSAQIITPPVAVDGTCAEKSFDYYRLAASKGQRISIEVFAQRLGTQLDSVVRLLDSSGRELAYSDDELGTQSDSRLSYVFETDGEYTIQLRDINYGGGPAHRYRLRVGDFPLVTVPYPLGGQFGKTRSISIAGPVVDGIPPSDIQVTEAGRPIAATRIPVRFPQGVSASFVTLLSSDLADTLEVEPNNERARATLASVPGALNGRFDESKDRDYFRFEAKKGQKLSFRGITRRLGSPSDLFFRLYDAKGAMLAEVEDSGSDEGRFDHSFAEDGSYALMIEDLLRRHGPEHAYRVEVREHAPSFSLRVEADTFDVPRGGVFVAKVICDRSGYDGPVELSIAGAGEGFELSGNVVGKGKKDTQLRVRVPERFETGEAVAFRITGSAKSEESMIHQTASSLAALRKTFSRTPYPPLELEGQLAFGVRAPFPDFFALTAPPSEIVLPRLTDGVTLRVEARRLDKAFQDPISVQLDGLPKGLVASPAAVPKGKSSTIITLGSTTDLAAGSYPIRLRGQATFRNQPQEAGVEKVTIRVVEPLQVFVTAAGSAKAGETLKLRATIVRASSKIGPVELIWDSLPKGFDAPESSSVPADSIDVEFALKLASDLPPNSFHRIVVGARAKVGAAVVEAKSPFALVKVVAP